MVPDPPFRHSGVGLLENFKNASVEDERFTSSLIKERSKVTNSLTVLSVDVRNRSWSQ